MCILSLIKKKDEVRGIRLRSDWLARNNIDGNDILDFSTERASVLQQTYELCNLGLAFCSSKQEDITALQTAFDIVPSELELTLMHFK